MSFGTKLSSKTLLRQLSGVTETIRKLGDVRNMPDYTRARARRRAFGLVPKRLIVFPNGPYILRLSIDSSHFTSDAAWSAQYHGEYAAPEALNQESGDKVRAINWRTESTWYIGATYLEILIWHVMGYDELCDFRNRRSQPHSKPYFFTPAEPGTDGGIREHEAVVTIFQVLLSHTDGYVQKAVHLVQRMLQIDPDERPGAPDVELEFLHLATQEERADKEVHEQDEQEGHQHFTSRPEDTKNEPESSSPDTDRAYIPEPDLGSGSIPYEYPEAAFELGIPLWRPTPRETEHKTGEVANEDKEE